MFHSFAHCYPGFAAAPTVALDQTGGWGGGGGDRWTDGNWLAASSTVVGADLQLSFNLCGKSATSAIFYPYSNISLAVTSGNLILCCKNKSETKHTGRLSLSGRNSCEAHDFCLLSQNHLPSNYVELFCQIKWTACQASINNLHLCLAYRLSLSLSPSFPFDSV